MGLEGTIIKKYSGFYYVWDSHDVWECSLRGKFRVKKQNFLTGDRVIFSVIDESKKKAVIEKALIRRNELIRPSVSNIDQAVLVVSLKNPDPDLWLLDRLLIMSQANKIKPVICFNKADLVPDTAYKELSEKYRKTKIPILITSSKTKLGVSNLRELLENKVSVFAGPSGVGKSSLLNKVEPGLQLKTGEVSEKLDRGKHTTRYVELFHLSGGGLLADTPGFSRIYLPLDLKREFLINYYPDLLQYKEKCKFNTCLHREEPECAVRMAVEEGFLDRERYNRYLQILDEVIAQERRF